MTHECGDESVFVWVHLEDWIKDSEAASIVKMVRGDDGVEAFRQLNNRFDPHMALIKSIRLKTASRRTLTSRLHWPSSRTSCSSTRRTTARRP